MKANVWKCFDLKPLLWKIDRCKRYGGMHEIMIPRGLVRLILSFEFYNSCSH